MVLKVSKGGVRSGNTLRGLRCLRTRRYLRQACLVTRSTLAPGDLPQFLEPETDHHSLESALRSTDVILSLNKRKRWLVPATVRHMIQTGELDSEPSRVAMLEHHKLQRAANCVSFVCNRGRIGHIQPRNKRYFSLADTCDLSVSTRALRSATAQIIKGINSAEVKFRKGNDNTVMKTVNVNVLSGSTVNQTKRIVWAKDPEAEQILRSTGFDVERHLESKILNAKREEERDKDPGQTSPEYRIEVFYPCPASCSLTYSSKYTRVRSDIDGDDKTKEHSEIRSSKRKRKYRKHFSFKEWFALENEINNDHLRNVYEEEIQEEFEENKPLDTMSSSKENVDHDLLRPCYYQKRYPSNSPRDVRVSLTALLEQADKRRACRQPTQSRTGKNLHKVREEEGHLTRIELDTNVRSPRAHIELDTNVRSPRAHIELDTNVRSPRAHIELDTNVRSPRAHIELDTNVRSPRAHIELDTNVRSPRDQKACVTSPGRNLEMPPVTGRVLLAVSQTDRHQLTRRFGSRYAEAESQPRRFVINITEQVQEHLACSNSSGDGSTGVSFLVFTYLNSYDTDHHFFQVRFNSSVCTDTSFLSGLFPLQAISIEELMHCVSWNLLDMKKKNKLSWKQGTSDRYMSLAHMTNVYDIQSYLLKSNQTSENWSRMSRKSMNVDTVMGDTMNEDVLSTFEMFCDVCCEHVDLSEAISTSATLSDDRTTSAFMSDGQTTSATLLTRCGHVLCDRCWQTYFRKQLNKSSVKLCCPVHECNVLVGPVTLLSLLHVSEICQIFERFCQAVVQLSDQYKLCPDPQCGLVVRVEGGQPVDGRCSCGQKFCQSCLAPPHWPALCSQAAAYRQRRFKRGSGAGDEQLAQPKGWWAQPRHEPPPSVRAALSKPAGKHRQYVEIEGRLCPKCRGFLQRQRFYNVACCRCGTGVCWNCTSSRYHYNCGHKKYLLMANRAQLRVRNVYLPQLDTLLRSMASSEEPDTPPSPAEVRDETGPEAGITGKQTLTRSRMMVNKSRHMVCDDRQLRLKVIDLLKQDYSSNTTGLKSTLTCIDTSKLSSAPMEVLLLQLLQCGQELRPQLVRVTEFTLVLLQDLPDCLDKRRTRRLVGDLRGYSSFMESILELGSSQDLPRLVEIHQWVCEALSDLGRTVRKIRTFLLMDQESADGEWWEGRDKE